MHAVCCDDCEQISLTISDFHFGQAGTAAVFYAAAFRNEMAVLWLAKVIDAAVKSHRKMVRCVGGNSESEVSKCEEHASHYVISGSQVLVLDIYRDLRVIFTDIIYYYSGNVNSIPVMTEIFSCFI